MPAQPVLTVEWTSLDHFTMDWTHDGVDIFGWYFLVWIRNTSTYIVSQQTFNTSLRTFVVGNGTALVDDTEYAATVTALSASGHVISREAYIANGHQVSHTFFDGTEFSWAEHDSVALNLGDVVPAIPGDDWFFQPSMDFTHISHAQLPVDFLVATAIPLAVTGGATFIANTGAALTSPDSYTTPHLNLFGRPNGYTPSWTVAPTYPGTGTITGFQSDSEWLIPSWVDSEKTIDPIATNFNAQSNYPTIINPQTGVAWTRAEVMSYYWGWAWYAWSSYISIADQSAIFVNPSPPPALIIRPEREVVREGVISMFKVYVDYALPPTYSDDPGPPPPDPTGIVTVDPTSVTAIGGERHDTYYDTSSSPAVEIEVKIPNPTVKTAFFGE